MPRYALKIEYHGGPFAGWQRQSQGLASVQGAVEAALAKLEPRAHTIAAAGRTDAGVHATGQVATLDMERDWDPFRLMEALNHHLRPEPVAILAAVRVEDDFHARFSALERRYLFRLIQRRAPLTHDAQLAWRVQHSLDLAAMRAGAAHLIGLHDFTTFRDVNCQSKSPEKTLDVASVRRVGEEVHLVFEARSFLHRQVRSMTGTLAEVGLGRWTIDDVATALAARDRAACGPVAPSTGLYLTGVRY